MKRVLVPLISSFHVESLANYAKGYLGSNDFFLSVLVSDSTQTRILHDRAPEVIPSTEFRPFEVLRDIEVETISDEPYEGLHRLIHYCNQNKINIRFQVAWDNNWEKAIIAQSAFSDLVLYSYNHEFDQPSGNPEREHLHTLLHGLHCPVLIIPSEYKSPEFLLLTYDHTPSSAFAIRQFSYLFPDLCKNRQAHIITIGNILKEKYGLEKGFEEMISSRFKSYCFKHFEGQVGEVLETYFKTFGSAVLTLGSCGRSRLSEFFMPSIGEELAKKSILPLFISHT